MSRLGLRRYLFVVVALVGVTQLFWGCGEPPGPIKGEHALKHAREILAAGPRTPGSPAIRKVADYIEQSIRKLGLEAKRDRWTDPKEKIEFENVWTEIPGSDPNKGPVVIIGAHYDSKICTGHPDPAHNFEFVGAVDSAGSCGLLLDLARALKKRANVPDLWIVWFDGEESLEFEWNHDRSLFGSRRFRDGLKNDPARLARVKALILLDLIGARDQKIDRDTFSNPKLLKVFADAAQQMGASDKVFQYESPMHDDHVPFQQIGIPVIDLIDFTFRDPNRPLPAGVEFEQWWHTPDDTVDKLSAPSLQFAGNLIWVAMPAIETAFCK